jgi:hypothetical protein
MKKSILISIVTLIVFSICTLIFPVTADCQDNSGAIKLSYSYPSGNPVRYLSVSNVNQDMDINGQSMVVKVVATLGCSITASGKDGNNQVLDVKVDTLAQTTDTPGGFMGGAIREVIGKSFSMKLSPTGKETDLSGAEKITFTSGEGTGTLAESFHDFFPDLPENAVSNGFTWKSSDTINSKSTAMSLVMVINSENKFEGLEQVNGISCAKISFTLSGTRDLKTQTQGMDIGMKGPFTGTGLLYFATDKGYFIRLDVKTRMTGSLEVSSPDAMTFPVVLDMNSVVEAK